MVPLPTLATGSTTGAPGNQQVLLAAGGVGVLVLGGRLWLSRMRYAVPMHSRPVLSTKGDFIKSCYIYNISASVPLSAAAHGYPGSGGDIPRSQHCPSFVSDLRQKRGSAEVAPCARSLVVCSRQGAGSCMTACRALNGILFSRLADRLIHLLPEEGFECDEI